MKDQLLGPLRSIARDLIGKKLWPIAVLLIAALAAVPIMIGSGSDSASTAAAPPVTPAAGSGALGAKSLVTLAEAAVTGKDDRAGAVKDPFYDPPDEPEAAAAASGGGGAAGGGVAAKPATSGASPATADKPAVDKPAEEKPTEAAPQPSKPGTAAIYYRTVVRWSQSGDAKARPIARLTPLGGLANTAALYLGVTKTDATYVIFLLGANATSDGEAKCADADCRLIGLKSGQSGLVTVQSPGGAEAHRFRLSVVSAKSVETDAAEARAMRAKVHPDGRDAMRTMWQDSATAKALLPIQYDADSGMLAKRAATSDVEKASE